MEKQVIKAVPVSGGTAAGRICILRQSSYFSSRRMSEEADAGQELAKLDEAILKTRREVSGFRDDLKCKAGARESRIFDLYGEILADACFIEEIKNEIISSRVLAESAVTTCFSRYIKQIENSEDDYLKQRIADLDDVKQQIIKNLDARDPLAAEESAGGQIVVINELMPTTALLLGNRGVAGVAAARGASPFSHAAIILRSLGIAAVNGIDFERMKAFDGKLCIVNGREGVVTVWMG